MSSQSRRRKGVRAGSARNARPVAVVGPGVVLAACGSPVSTSGGASRTAGLATTTPERRSPIPDSAPPFGDNNPAKKRKGEIECGTLSGQWVSDHDGDCPEPHPLRRFWISGKGQCRGFLIGRRHW